MDGTTFDTLARSASKASTRRGALGMVLGGVAAAAFAGTEIAARRGKGKKGGKRKKRCKKLTQGCGGKSRCCKSLTCTNGVCACPAGTVASGNACVPQSPAPDCTSNAQCDAGEVCQGGTCVPAQPECTSNADCDNAGEVCVNGVCVPQNNECENDNDCGPNERCEAGPNGKICFCPDAESGRCIRRCERQSDCPGVCSCRNHFPETSEFIEDGICIKEPFILCDAKTCDADSDCKSNEICIGTGCGSNGTTFRCSPICVD